MQKYPSLNQQKFAKKLLKDWDVIIGTHSHYPQPITLEKIKEKNKILAYSLGDFGFLSIHPLYQKGIVLKITTTKNNNPVLTKCSYKHIKFKVGKKIKVEIDDKK
jgi:poly-gamma-glutamate capsule biosynthesis protein CapA/YwtB (metallophosphatase superfamily)